MSSRVNLVVICLRKRLNQRWALNATSCNWLVWKLVPKHYAVLIGLAWVYLHHQTWVLQEVLQLLNSISIQWSLVNFGEVKGYIKPDRLHRLPKVLVKLDSQFVYEIDFLHWSMCSYQSHNFIGKVHKKLSLRPKGDLLRCWGVVLYLLAVLLVHKSYGLAQLRGR